MKVLSLFSGIGAFEKALDRLNIEWELVNFCEFDKYAIKSYCAIHGVDESKNLGDITKVDEKKLPKDIDLITYGFPCQDISLAGKQKGLFNPDGTKTRSGLFFEALRIIEETQPKVAIAENVKALTSKKFNAQFQIVLASLEAAGYNNYWQVLNAKEFGVPQNRERVFIVSIRKDIDTGCFKFSEGFPLELRLKDVLENEVDEKFYINKEQYGELIEDPKGDEIKTIGYMTGNSGRFEKHQSNTVYSTDGLCPTQYAGQYKDPFRIREATSKGYAEAYEGDSINLEQPNSQTRRGRVGKQVAQTLTTSCNQAVAVAMRGRYSEDGTVEQKFEISNREYSNALTTVQKDSLIAEPNVLTPKRTEYGKKSEKHTKVDRSRKADTT